MFYADEVAIKQAVLKGDGRAFADAIGDMFAPDFEEIRNFVENTPGGWNCVKGWNEIEVGGVRVVDRNGRPVVKR